ncbi:MULTISPECIES: hypothetical protein [Roseobacteraceae]|uniref:Uncharacterized protein n=1 Tax=Celeribacter baekdonensis B30 TaxID=1208323 RepID=K2JD89_9RHOB|nr:MULTISPECIES: hypothetical protein [Roseobacteraceae]EKE72647.1 hypothetical protein B30_06686 [Celeribacter baekdonensis B30]KAB6715388.1 hypothetical protein C8029_15685 [Roseobacter sp. TSBP12]|tara:strand:+ start:1850 stop:2404 length:555 start_codon:yes stop_codon:yes gene_type:complete
MLIAPNIPQTSLTTQTASATSGPQAPVTHTTERRGFTAQTSAPTAEAIYADYDFTNISPDEIDDMADRLREAGAYEFSDMMMLETRGTRFQQHLCDCLYEAGITNSRSFDGAQKSDVIASFTFQIEMSRRAGDPTEFAQKSLDRLEEIHAQAQADRAKAQAVPSRAAPTPALAQSLLGFMAQSG